MHLHDPENISFEEGVAPGGPLEALQALKEEGVIAHLGVAGGPIDLLRQLHPHRRVRRRAHAQPLLRSIDQSAEPLLDEAQELGVAVLNAAPFGGGVLAGAPQAQGYYAYREAGPGDPRADRGAARRLRPPRRPARGRRASSSRLRDPRIVSTVAGVSQPERVDRLVELASTPIPPELWDELDTPTREATT